MVIYNFGYNYVVLVYLVLFFELWVLLAFQFVKANDYRFYETEIINGWWLNIL